MAEYICRNCGASLSPEAEKCSQCGYSPHPEWAVAVVAVLSALSAIFFTVGVLVSTVEVYQTSWSFQALRDFLTSAALAAGGVQATRWGLRERQKTVAVRVPQSRTHDPIPDADD